MHSRALSGIKQCSECGLCRNQRPLLDEPRAAEVLWVGLSAVKVNDTEASRPLAPETRSGKVVEEIERCLTETSFYRTNLVKCLPQANGKIRYPKHDEMESCFPHLWREVQALAPKVVLLLGKQVAEYVLGKLGAACNALGECFSYTSIICNGVAYIPIHHPSFVLIYRRRSLEVYINEICASVREHLKAGCVGTSSGSVVVEAG